MPINALRAFTLDVDIDYDIVMDAPAQPQWAIVREIDFRIDPTAAGDQLVFYYSQYKQLLPVAPGAFPALLQEICQSGYAFDGGRSDPDEPFSTLLSLNSRQVLAYVVFKLAPGRWQFARAGRPIKIGGAGNHAGAYYDANRVDPLGQADPGDPGIIKDGCQVAYFISDGAHVAPDVRYQHPFNLYVDLLVNDYEPMPLKIDPDIRHPGGSDD